ncbi:MAG: hypothetical protein P8Y78_09465, partial [Acidihalobacter sp.]
MIADTVVLLEAGKKFMSQERIIDPALQCIPALWLDFIEFFFSKVHGFFLKIHCKRGSDSLSGGCRKFKSEIRYRQSAIRN